VNVLDGGSNGGDLADTEGLLASLRVLDLSGDDGDAVTRLLADLGADVLKVEPPGGSPSRTRAPTLRGTGLRFALHNANKRSTVLDPADPDDRTRLVELAGSADILVDSGNPGQVAAYGISCPDLADRYPQLVALSITDFGTTGAAVVVASDRSGALCPFGFAVAVGPRHRNTGVTAGRDRVGHRRRTSRLGRAGRILQPITLRYRGLHRFFPVRRGRDGARSGARGTRAGRRRAART
jgi:hypothetical protein